MICLTLLIVGVKRLLNNIYLFSREENIMNQEKIGKFIAKCRKNQTLTQEQLADKLNITYKAASNGNVVKVYQMLLL